MLAGCSSDGNDKGRVDGSGDDTLNVAYMAQPPSFDPHVTVAVATGEIARNTFETLLAFNADNEVEPVLAESFETSEDGKTITFHLRQGIQFHNGEEMTADDVVASMERWKDLNGKANAYFGNSEFSKVDDYTVLLKMDKPLSIAKYILASNVNFAAIMPKAVIDEAEPTGVKEFIGTGPFKFEDWKQDQYIKFVKNENYISPGDSVNGLVGKKDPLVDTVYYHFIADSSTRTAGIRTGEYDVALSIPGDSVSQLEGDSNLKAHFHPGGFMTVVFNNRNGLFTDQKAREAVNLAVKKEDVMLAAFSGEEFYVLEHGLLGKDYVSWYNEAGKEKYDSDDPEEAKKLMKEAGYNGEKVRILTTRDYEDQYHTAVVIQQQLEEIGVAVDLQVYDWPSLMDVREDDSFYDLMVMGYSPATDPTQINFLDSRTNYTGWTDSPEIDALLDDLMIASSDEEAKEIFSQLQAENWSYLPAIKFGDYNRVTATYGNLEGFEYFHGAVVWNVSKSE